MSDKQERIVEFIERNTEHKMSDRNVSEFIGEFWQEAQHAYRMKRTTGVSSRRNIVSEREVDLYNFAGDNDVNEYEAESMLGMDFPMGGIHSSSDM